MRIGRRMMGRTSKRTMRRIRRSTMRTTGTRTMKKRKRRVRGMGRRVGRDNTRMTIRIRRTMRRIRSRKISESCVRKVTATTSRRALLGSSLEGYSWAPRRAAFPGGRRGGGRAKVAQ